MPSIAQLEKLLTADPRDTFVLYALAQEFGKQREHERAIEFYDRCLAVDPHYCYAYYHKARSLESLKRADELKATLEAGLRAAKEAQDRKALSEISSYLATL